MKWLVAKLVDLCRPWHDNGLPDELQFGEIELWGFTRGYMRRMAELSVANGFPFGLFDVVGMEYARRAARAWWPFELLIMEDVSCAVRPIEKCIWEGRPVPEILVDRLVALLHRYVRYVGGDWGEEEVRAAVARYIRDEAARQALRDEFEGASPG